MVHSPRRSASDSVTTVNFGAVSVGLRTVVACSPPSSCTQVWCIGRSLSCVLDSRTQLLPLTHSLALVIVCFIVICTESSESDLYGLLDTNSSFVDALATDTFNASMLGPLVAGWV